MAMMKYGTAQAANKASLNDWGKVKTASVSREEEEERRKAQELARKSK